MKHLFKVLSAATQARVTLSIQTSSVITTVVNVACLEREIMSGIWTLRLLHGARKSNQIRAVARNCAYSQNSDPPSLVETERRDSLIPEIPSGMQPGLLSCSHCSRWIRAHQWLLELIILPEHKQFHNNGAAECAWVRRLKVFTAGLLLALPRHDGGFIHHGFQSEDICIKWKHFAPFHFSTNALQNKSNIGPSFFQQWFQRLVLRSAFEVAKLLESISFHWWASHKSLLWPEDSAECARNNQG